MTNHDRVLPTWNCRCWPLVDATRDQGAARVPLSNREDQRRHALGSAVSIYRNDQDHGDPSRNWLNVIGSWDHLTMSPSNRAGKSPISDGQ
jgi:hypothetical protein